MPQAEQHLAANRSCRKVQGVQAADHFTTVTFFAIHGRPSPHLAAADRRAGIGVEANDEAVVGEVAGIAGHRQADHWIGQ